jgi:hypothetical protein
MSKTHFFQSFTKKPANWRGEVANLKNFNSEKLRRGRDLNSRYPFEYATFPRWCTKPLCDLSKYSDNVSLSFLSASHPRLSVLSLHASFYFADIHEPMVPIVVLPDQNHFIT